MTEKELSKEARKLLDAFAASRERWFGNETDYKTWKSVRDVLYNEKEIYGNDGHNNSFIRYLEYLAEFAVTFTKKQNNLLTVLQDFENWRMKYPNLPVFEFLKDCGVD